MPVTIVSWNIAGGRPIRSDERFDYDKEDLEYFAEELKKLNPDIVALQESHKSETRSVAVELAKLTGLSVKVDDAFSQSHIDPEYQLSLAVLSRLGDVSTEDEIRFPYPKFPLTLPNGEPAKRHDKGMQVVEFEVGDAPLHLINLQMLPLPFLGASYESEEGNSFAKEMENTMSPYVVPSLSIIAGDFNYGKSETLYVDLLKGMKSVLPNAPTRPNGKKTDYIFVPNSYLVVESGIIETRSDHFLCFATLEIA